MKSFAERLRADRRLVLLRLLAEQNGYRSNSSVLHAGLMHLGIVSARDDVLTDLAWLADQGLLVQEEVAPGVVVATLTARGGDVASGLAVVPGVARPSPR